MMRRGMVQRLRDIINALHKVFLSLIPLIEHYLIITYFFYNVSLQLQLLYIKMTHKLRNFFEENNRRILKSIVILFHFQENIPRTSETNA